MGMGFAPTWLRYVSPLLHKTTLATACNLPIANLALYQTATSAPTATSATGGGHFPHGSRTVLTKSDHIRQAYARGIGVYYRVSPIASSASAPDC